MKAERNAQQRILGLLRPLFAIAILALVAFYLPWKDRLTWTRPDGSSVEVPGTIEGDWKAEEVVFQPDSPLPSGLPEALAETLGDGGPLEVVRATVDPDAAAPPTSPVLGWEPGMPRVFQSLDLLWFAISMAFFLGALCFGITRWWRLLGLADCPTGWFTVFRLTYLGLFFNFVIPGLTGGDVVKSLMVTREHPDRRAEAFMSVWVDRVLGLFMLASLAAVVVFALGDTFAELKLPIAIFLAVAVVGGLAYLNGGLRRLFRIDAILNKLPFGEKLRTLDNAVLVYRKHPWEIALALVLSLGNHACSILGVWALGVGFGADQEVTVWQYFALVPIANIVSSLPLTPAGLGLGEAVYSYLFAMIGARPTLGVAVSITFRIAQALLGLGGGLFLLMPGQKVDLDDLDDLESDDSDDSTPVGNPAGAGDLA